MQDEMDHCHPNFWNRKERKTWGKKSKSKSKSKSNWGHFRLSMERIVAETRRKMAGRCRCDRWLRLETGNGPPMFNCNPIPSHFRLICGNEQRLSRLLLGPCWLTRYKWRPTWSSRTAMALPLSVHWSVHLNRLLVRWFMLGPIRFPSRSWCEVPSADWSDNWCSFPS